MIIAAALCRPPSPYADLCRPLPTALYHPLPLPPSTASIRSILSEQRRLVHTVDVRKFPVDASRLPITQHPEPERRWMIRSVVVPVTINHQC
jgi:hypothetical protein